MKTIKKVEELLQQYKKQLDCDFSLYSPEKECIVSTEKKSKKNYKDESVLVSIEVGKDIFHLTTPKKKDKDFLMIVAIACKHLMTLDHQGLPDEEKLKLAFLNKLSNSELEDLKQRVKWKKPKQLLFLKFNKKDDEIVKSMLEHIIDGEIYFIERNALILIDYEKDNKKFAKELIHTMNTELMMNVSCCMSSKLELLEDSFGCYQTLYDLANLREIFNPNQEVVTQKDLDIAYLLSMIPVEKIKNIVSNEELTKFNAVDNEEDLRTIFTFFENDLNSSKTAQKLYLHRNTLIYRLDKYHKLTGFDIRKFEDALRFKLYLMIYQWKKEENCTNKTEKS